MDHDFQIRRKTMVASSAPFVTALVHTGALIPATALLVVLECRGRPLTSPMQAFSVQSTVRLSVIRMALSVTATTLPTRKLHVRKLAPSSSLSFLALSAPSVKMSGFTPDPTARISPLMSETVCEPTGLITLRLIPQANCTGCSTRARGTSLLPLRPPLWYYLYAYLGFSPPFPLPLHAFVCCSRARYSMSMF